MNATVQGQSLLLAQFNAFYSEVIRLKRLATSDLRVPVATQNGSEGPDQTPATTVVWQRLLAILEHPPLAPGSSVWEYGSEMYKEAQYVMAVLADETFLHLEWAGRDAWRANLLESRLFASHVAGELFFHKLERLLHLRDPAYVELATVYLMALALGFRGKFRGVDDGGQLDHYRQQLFVFIAHRHPRLVDEAQHLLPAAYAYTLDGERGQRLPEPRLWIILVVVLLLVFGGISYGVWSHVTTDLHGVLQRILTRR